MIAGERRWRAIRNYTGGQTIAALVIEIDDTGARRLSAAENLQREDLTVFETIAAIVELVDAELEGDDQFASMGDNPVDRVKALLARLHSTTISKNRGSQVSQEGQSLLDRFIQQLEKAVKKLPKPLEWRSFYKNDLNLLVETPQEVRDLAIQQKLNKSENVMNCATQPAQIIIDPRTWKAQNSLRRPIRVIHTGNVTIARKRGAACQAIGREKKLARIQRGRDTSGY